MTIKKVRFFNYELKKSNKSRSKLTEDSVASRDHPEKIC